MKKFSLLIIISLIFASLSACTAENIVSPLPSQVTAPNESVALQPNNDLSDAVTAYIMKNENGQAVADWKYDIVGSKLDLLCEALTNVILGEKTDEPIYDQANFSYVDPAQLYLISINCGGENGKLYNYTIFEQNTIQLPNGDFYLYVPETLNLDQIDALISEREYTSKQETDIEDARVAFIDFFAKTAPGCSLNEIWFDEQQDARWSDVAMHDSMLMPVSGKTNTDFITLCFSYSADNENSELWLEPDVEHVCVMMKENSEWTFFDWQ